MRSFFCFIIAMIFFLQPFGHLAIILNFKLNQALIAKTSCLKKDVPNNTCQGKCQLKKQIDHQREKDSTPAVKEKLFEIFYCHVNPDFLSIPSGKKTYTSHNRFVQCSSPLYRCVDHPPNA